MMKNALRNESGVFGTYALAVVATVSAAVVAVLLLGAAKTGGSEPWLGLFEAEAGPVWLDVGVPKYEWDVAPIAQTQPAGEIAAASGATSAYRDYDADAEQIPPSF
jgi:hypothetical protein